MNDRTHSLERADPYHDIGLFVFFSGWLALGLSTAPASRRRDQTGRLETAAS